MAISATLTFGIASVAQAEDTATADQAPTEANASGAQRINLSGKLRMLSQRVPASACYLQAGVSTTDSRAMLVAAQQEFVQITNALANGDPDLQVMSAETRRKTLRGIELVQELWAPVSGAADQITASTGTSDTVTQIANNSAPLLEMAQKLVTVISEQYSNPGELLLRDSLAIDIAGRQRMLAQRISKDICLISTGQGSDAISAELQSAADTFGASLLALRNGMPAAGIQQPPSAEIAEGLDWVIADWVSLQPLIAQVMDGGQLDNDQLATVFSTSNRLTGGMNAVVGLYSAVTVEQS